MDWIIVASVCGLIIATFIAGWKLGGSAKQKDIALKGLKDVNQHYEKMADDFKTVDSIVDNAKRLLSGKLFNSKSRNAKVSKTSRTANSNGTQEKPK